jgi:magnesium transporter
VKIHSYRIRADSGAALEVSEDFLGNWRQAEESYWVDIHSYAPDELKAWLNNLALSDMAMKNLLEAGQAARYLPLQGEVFFSFQVYPGDLETEPVYLSFLCMPNLVLTLHDVPIDTLDNAIAGLISGLSLFKPTTSALVCLLLLLESMKSLKLSNGLKKAVFDLDNRMDDNPDLVEGDEIVDQKRLLRSLDSVVDAQHQCFEFMANFNMPFLDLRGLAAQFQMVPSNALAANQNVDRLEKTISDIQQRFNTNQQEKTNRRLAILTILSAIFMPLTFIAGIYGMNFDKMPELHFDYSYPVVLIIMALIAIGMFLFFKTRGWLE